MKTQSKALVLSVILHVSLVFFFLCMNNSITRSQNILMVDFTLEPSSPTPMAIVTASKLAHSKRVNEQLYIKENISKNDHVLRDQNEVEDRTSQSLEQIPSIDAVFPNIIDKDINDEKDKVLLVDHEKVLQNNSTRIARNTIKEKNVSSSLLHHQSSGIQSGYMKNHFTYIRDMIQKKLVYPKIAREMGWEGKVAVSFYIASNGLAKEIKIVSSSGKESLDKNALLAVQTASPFPKPPVDAYIKIPIVYRLH